MRIKHKNIQKLSIAWLIAGLFFVLFSLFHSSVYALLPSSHGHSPAKHAESVPVCIQQCTAVTSEIQKIDEQEKDNHDPAIDPFIFVLAATLPYIYLLSIKLFGLIQRHSEIPIYKQVSSYRI